MATSDGKKRRPHMKKYKTGLVIGKFLPFHKGHEKLIEEASKKVEKLTVIVCHTKGYDISPEIRRSWVENAFPRVDVRIFEHKKYLDDDSPKKSKIWAEITLSFLGFTPDVVFTSEEYGLPYANFMGSKHIMFDKFRRTVPISGTKVRANPHKYWEMIGEDVRAYYAKRIVILGAESTGTTTLAKDLAKYYKTAWVPEYGRIYYEGRQYSKFDKWNTEEFVQIAKVQNRLEDKLAKKSNKLLICDTDSFTTGIWHKRYMNKRSSKVLDVSKNRKYDLYILTAPDIPFAQDGTRDGEHLRKWMHKVFIQELRKLDKKFVVVKGSKKERLRISVKRINKLF